ncbi:hypothetical protein J43TS9_31600 [Paenibacillus cineris]|nr:hypothetical protein J43TS9_31600 [Paenibacillus cineris]
MKLDGNIIRISGLDIDWEEIELSTEQAVAEHYRIVDQITASILMQSKNVPDNITKSYLNVVALHQRTYGGRHPLAHIMFGTDELLWLVVVSRMHKLSSDLRLCS